MYCTFYSFTYSCIFLLPVQYYLNEDDCTFKFSGLCNIPNQVYYLISYFNLQFQCFKLQYHTILRAKYTCSLIIFLFYCYRYICFHLIKTHINYVFCFHDLKRFTISLSQQSTTNFSINQLDIFLSWCSLLYVVVVFNFAFLHYSCITFILACSCSPFER